MRAQRVARTLLDLLLRLAPAVQKIRANRQAAERQHCKGRQ
jgi:hypothetical protein